MGGLLYVGTGSRFCENFAAQKFFGGSAILRLRSERFGFSRRWTAYHQASIANFVNHGAIADLQSLRSLAAVPMIGAQCFDNGVAFHFPDGLFGDFLERHWLAVCAGWRV